MIHEGFEFAQDVIGDDLIEHAVGPWRNTLEQLERAQLALDADPQVRLFRPLSGAYKRINLAGKALEDLHRGRLKVDINNQLVEIVRQNHALKGEPNNPPDIPRPPRSSNTLTPEQTVHDGLLGAIDVARRKDDLYPEGVGVRFGEWFGDDFRDEIQKFAKLLVAQGMHGEVKFVGRGVQSMVIALASHPDLVVKMTLNDGGKEFGGIIPGTFRILLPDLAAMLFRKGRIDKIRWGIFERIAMDRDRVEDALLGGDPVARGLFQDLVHRAALRGFLIDDRHGDNFGFRVHPDGEEIMVAVDEGTPVPVKEIEQMVRKNDAVDEMSLMDLLRAEHYANIGYEKWKKGDLLLPEFELGNKELSENILDLEAQLKAAEADGLLDAVSRGEFEDLLEQQNEKIHEANKLMKALEKHASCVSNQGRG